MSLEDLKIHVLGVIGLIVVLILALRSVLPPLLDLLSDLAEFAKKCADLRSGARQHSDGEIAGNDEEHERPQGIGSLDGEADSDSSG